MTSQNSTAPAMTAQVVTSQNGTLNASPVSTPSNIPNFATKLESELSSAPKGLILIVKEPGESNLIAGEQVDGNLSPISTLTSTTTENGNISRLNMMASKVGLMSNKMGTMNETAVNSINLSTTLAPSIAVATTTSAAFMMTTNANNFSTVTPGTVLAGNSNFNNSVPANNEVLAGNSNNTIPLTAAPPVVFNNDPTVQQVQPIMQ